MGAGAVVPPPGFVLEPPPLPPGFVLEDKATPAIRHPETVSSAVTQPLRRIPEIYREELEESRRSLSDKNLFTKGLGALRYSLSPITAAVRGLAGEPAKLAAETAGVPQPETVGTIAELLVPGVGLTRLPGTAAKLAQSGRIANVEALKGGGGEVRKLGRRYDVPLTYAMETGGGRATKIESVLSEMSLSGMAKRLEEGQQKVKAAAADVAGKAAEKLAATQYKGLKSVETAAAKGNSRARRLLQEIEDAGDDWKLITKSSAGLKHFRGQQIANRLYSKVEALAGQAPVPITKAIKSLENAIAEQSASIIPDAGTLKGLTQLRDSLQSGSFSYGQVRQARTAIGKTIDSYYKGKGALIGEQGVGAWVDVKKALEADLDEFAKKADPALRGAHMKANSFYKKHADVFKNRTLASALKDIEPGAIYAKFVRAYKEGGGDLLYKALDPKGKAAIKAGMIENAVSAATGATGVFSPAKYSTYMTKHLGTALSKSDRMELEGFSKLMRSTERFGQFAEAPPTGNKLVQMLPWLVSPIAATGQITAGFALTRLLTTEKGKALLRAASAMKPGAPTMRTIERGLKGILVTRAPLLGSDDPEEIGSFAAEALTPYGSYVSARDAIKDLEQGNYGLAALGAIGAIPVASGAKAALRRAKEAGFDVANKWYHGSNQMIPDFDDAKRGTVTGGTIAGSQLAGIGHFASSSKKVADKFAELAAKTQGGKPARIPLYSAKKGRVVLDFTNLDEPHSVVAANLLEARDSGARTAILKGVRDSVSGKKSDVLVIFDPSAVRRPTAAFDPAKLDSANLLAGLASLGLGVQVLRSTPEEPRGEDTSLASAL